jgi:excisionase family DNA binding protein
MVEKLLYTIDEACAALAISPATIYRDLAAGKMVGRKRGHRTYIMAEDLKNYLAALPPFQSRAGRR